MKVIFVNYTDFQSQSGMHIFHLANSLATLGVAVSVCSFGDEASVTRYGKPKFASYDIRLEREKLAGLLKAAPGDSLVVHCWTPRENIRVYAEALAVKLRAPVIVHMEDNEEAITAACLEHNNQEKFVPGSRGYEELWLPGRPMYFCSHPRSSGEFMARAGGFTCIIEALLDFKPENVPGLVFWPSCEPEVFELPPESSPEDKLRWGLDPKGIALFYPGNAHLLNYEEILQLYAAVALLRRLGLPAQIIKFGKYIMNVQEQLFEPLGMRDAVVDLTDRITPAEIPQVMRAADILVQPGEENPFNHYRFPCKLPLFLASARPVILPPANLGRHLSDGENCLLLRDKKAEAIAVAVNLLVNNPRRAGAIGRAGRDFARKHFSWDKSASKLKSFYDKLLSPVL
jgi:glycosyltransferase involved in cell wall biosynthesis